VSQGLVSPSEDQQEAGEFLARRCAHGKAQVSKSRLCFRQFTEGRTPGIYRCLKSPCRVTCGGWNEHNRVGLVFLLQKGSPLRWRRLGVVRRSSRDSRSRCSERARGDPEHLRRRALRDQQPTVSHAFPARKSIAACTPPRWCGIPVSR